MAVHAQLWMGGLEPYMTESFIMEAFKRMGENPQSVKVMKNRYTGELAGYCFVHFLSDESALDAMHKLNGKIIPNTNASPPLRFKLNHAGPAIRSTDREYSLWVGDLSTEVDDYSLYRTFASRYPSTRTAKVIMDNQGYSKGYGFIRFGSEDEQKNCLVQMNGFKGLGTKPIKISNAIPKMNRIPPNDGYTSSQDYSGYYDSSYWQNYAAWQNYYDTTNPSSQSSSTVDIISQKAIESSGHEDDLELVEHNIPVDVERLNKELVERDYILWDALESSKWLPVEGMDCGA